MKEKIAVKVWCPNLEPEPSGLFNKSSCPTAPPNWFKAGPELAAELYALELGNKPNLGCWKKYYINVLDNEKQLHQFCFKVGHELTAYRVVEK